MRTQKKPRRTVQPVVQKGVVKDMSNKSIFILCLISYLLLVLLIAVEPIGYNPILLCIFFFFVFLVLFIFLTNSIPKALQKLPKKIRALIKGISIYLEYLLVFLLGWIMHEIWVVGKNSYLNYYIIVILTMSSIMVVRRGYKNYLGD